MRKHDVRKWLHAVLDLLPVILIPVFMIYSHRHDVTETTTINYKYESNEVNTLDDLIEGNIYSFSQNINFYSDGYSAYNLDIITLLEYDFNDFSYVVNDVYLYDYISSQGNLIHILTTNFDDGYISFTNDNGYVELYFEIFDINLSNFTFIYNNTLYNFLDGEGLLPQYTDYNVIESVDIENTDVMDSFMNHFNNTIDKHFNMGNVFNLNGVYQWFNTNIFSGNAPTVIYSIWNIALYELVMDLLFLLYGLFMWFIDMIQKLMEKPLNSVK